MLIILHGSGSSPKESVTVQTIINSKRLSDTTMFAPEYDSKASHSEIRVSLIKFCDEKMKLYFDEIVTFVGTSLGGYWAKHLANHYKQQAVLVNPAIEYYGENEKDNHDIPLIVFVGKNDEVVNPTLTINTYKYRAKLILKDGDHRMHEFLDDIIDQIIFIKDHFI